MILTTNLMYRTTIRRFFKYGMRGYGVLLRVPDQDGTYVRQLASRFSDAFHRAGQEMRKRQNADVSHIPPHRSIRAKDLVPWARIRAGRPFLEGYSAFCMLAALWEHNCAWTRDEVPIGYTFFEDAKGNPLDYETREMSMDSNIECEYAIRASGGFGQAQLSDEFSLSEEHLIDRVDAAYT
ncbi:hypothetical protein OC835_004476 [Tilletia horrida]|nr:hypothetical protein OC835_004476 [Tilletia horrida]